MRPIRSSTGVLIVLASAVLSSGVDAGFAAAVIVHESVEFFFESGGTHVTDCFGLGCPAVSFVVGTVSGDVPWLIQEKVFQDELTGTTLFTYALFNETLDPAITSFEITSSGVLAHGRAPAGWTFTQTDTAWSWHALDPSVGVQVFSFLDGFEAEVDRLISVEFKPTSIDLADGQGLSSSSWVASAPVSAPTSLLLMTSGALGAGAMFWRRLAALWTSRRAPRREVR